MLNSLAASIFRKQATVQWLGLREAIYESWDVLDTSIKTMITRVKRLASQLTTYMRWMITTN